MPAARLATENRDIFPNLSRLLYPPGEAARAGKGTKVQSVSYECKRKFCTFCLRTNYDDNITDVLKNKNWHCHHCTGYCICTRCLRQDITSQQKAFLISLGGNLNVLRRHSQSLFDQVILRNFNEHLELTLGQNQGLYKQFPYYLYMLNGRLYSDLKAKRLADPQRRPLPVAGPTLASSVASQKALSPEELRQQKVAIQLLFQYGLLNKKIDDGANVLCQQHNLVRGEQLTDKRFHEFILRSVRLHSADLITTIQKRRGRRKFILSGNVLAPPEEPPAAPDQLNPLNFINKREKKYLQKVQNLVLSEVN
mmetsp:Transcript_4895/g.8381  ORF Transcript_4895/g.8381 Transcript_4895/m.8381 type:complete len:309 (-) Transcript_4895:428-1354(-)